MMSSMRKWRAFAATDLTGHQCVYLRRDGDSAPPEFFDVVGDPSSPTFATGEQLLSEARDEATERNAAEDDALDDIELD